MKTKTILSALGVCAGVCLSAPALKAAALPAAPAKQALKKHRLQKSHSGKREKGLEARKAEVFRVKSPAPASAPNRGAVPVQTITSKQIAQTGSTTLGDFLQRMPSVGSAGTGNAEPNGGGGVSCTDLRNLGQKEVLTLIDGKRMAIDGAAMCVDTNTIPVQLVQSVDLMKDGGEAEYGADALGGVMNIRLRHDVSDAAITMRGGITGKGDGQTGMLSAYKGWNFDGKRGNITLFGSYNTTSGIMQKNRKWANPLYDGDGSPMTSGEGPMPWVRKDGKDVGHGPSAYNYARWQSLTNDLHVGSLYGDAHYDLNRHFTVYSNVLYSHRNSMGQMAPQSFNGVLGSNLPVYIPLDGFPGHDGEEVVGERFVGLGPRREENSSDTYTAKGGLHGEIYRKWMYDASFTYGVNQTLDRNLNQGDYAALLDAYGYNHNTGKIWDSGICQNNPGGACVSPLTPADQLPGWVNRAINRTTDTYSYYALRDWNLRIHKDNLTRMPWRYGGGFSVGFGYERRSEQFSQHQDPLVQSGQSMNMSAQNTGGGVTSNAGYLQGVVHILRNAPGAKDFSIGGQGRVDDYSSVGVTKSWKGTFQYAPVRDIRFRGTLGQSFRAPGVMEMYAGRNTNADQGTDPTGVDKNTQFTAIQGGNPNLGPEMGRTWTIGTVITPRAIPRFSFSVGYWNTYLKNAIGYVPLQYVLDQENAGNKLYHSWVTRNENGMIQSVYTPQRNLGGTKTDGIDWDLSYSLPLNAMDTLVLTNSLQQLLSFREQYAPGERWMNYTGKLLYQVSSLPNTSGGYPKIKNYTTATWRHGRFSLTYMMQYLGGMQWNTGSVDVNARNCAAKDSVCNGFTRSHTGGVFSHDLTAAYRLKKWNFEAGIQNLTNQRPPFVPDGQSNSSASLYGNLYTGRYFFLQAGANF